MLIDCSCIALRTPAVTMNPKLRWYWRGTQTKQSGWLFDSWPWNHLSTWQKTSYMLKHILCSKNNFFFKFNFTLKKIYEMNAKVAHVVLREGVLGLQPPICHWWYLMGPLGLSLTTGTRVPCVQVSKLNELPSSRDLNLSICCHSWIISPRSFRSLGNPCFFHEKKRKGKEIAWNSSLPTASFHSLITHNWHLKEIGTRIQVAHKPFKTPQLFSFAFTRMERPRALDNRPTSSTIQ